MAALFLGDIKAGNIPQSAPPAEIAVAVRNVRFTLGLSATLRVKPAFYKATLSVMICPEIKNYFQHFFEERIHQLPFKIWAMCLLASLLERSANGTKSGSVCFSFGACQTVSASWIR